MHIGRFFRKFRQGTKLLFASFLVGSVLFAVIYAFFGFVAFDRRGQNVQMQEIARKQMEERQLQDIQANLKALEKEHPLFTTFVSNTSCSLVGILCDGDISSSKESFEGSILGKATALVVVPFAHPPSSASYIAKDLLENAGFAPKTYAQGIGFSAIQTFRTIWKVFRDLAYLILVLLMVIVGFMVMFQVNVGDKAAMSLEAALPKLVITLLIISFSYAIVGLLIDLMYISIIVVISLLGPAAGMTPFDRMSLVNATLSNDPTLNIMWIALGNKSDLRYPELADAIWSLVPGYIQGLVNSIVTAGWTRIIWLMSSGPVANSGLSLKDVLATNVKGGKLDKMADAFRFGAEKLMEGLKNALSPVEKGLNDLKGGGAGTWAVSIIAAVLSFLLWALLANILSAILVKLLLVAALALTAAYLFVRIIFFIFTVYVEILVSIFFAPIILMFEVIPGQNVFVGWVKGLAVNLAIFPLLTVMFLVVRIILQATDTGYSLWAPPYAVSFSDSKSFALLVAGFIFYSIPDLLGKFKEQFGSKSAMGGFTPSVFFSGFAPIVTAAGMFVKSSGLEKAVASQISKPLRSFVGDTGKSALGASGLDSSLSDH